MKSNEWGVWVHDNNWVQCSFRGQPIAWTKGPDDAAKYTLVEADVVLAILNLSLPPDIPRGRTEI